MTLSLKSEILEHLKMDKGGKKIASKNIKKATKDFYASDAPQFQGKPKAKRHQMAIAAGLAAARGESAHPKAGDKMIYEGKQATVQSINEATGMAVVKLPRMRDSKIVRLTDLKTTQNLNEGFFGMAPILPTWRDTGPSQFVRTDLTADDIGLEIIGLHEDEFTGEDDDQEDVADNGSNVRYDGHTGKKEVDELPTPSDTIAVAYDDDKPPKVLSQPLSTEPGYTVAKDPDLQGYDFPADAPEIPQPEFQGADAGNPRAPTWGDIHEPGKNSEDRDADHEGDEDDDEGDEEKEVEESYMGFDKLKNKLSHKKGIHDPGAVAASVGRKKYGKKNFQSHAAHSQTFEGFMAEMDDLLGHGEDREPHNGDSITLTLPAMASIVCTVAHKVGHNHELLKSMIEALDEVGHGKTIDLPDLEAVASHMNGEETQEVENRDAGMPDHEGLDMHGDEQPHHEPADSWPGDGEKTQHGKTKLMGGVAESEEKDDDNHDDEEVDECNGEIKESNYYGWTDMVAEYRAPTEEEELREMKRRAGLRFW